MTQQFENLKMHEFENGVRRNCLRFKLLFSNHSPANLNQVNFQNLQIITFSNLNYAQAHCR